MGLAERAVMSEKGVGVDWQDVRGTGLVEVRTRGRKMRGRGRKAWLIEVFLVGGESSCLTSRVSR